MKELTTLNSKFTESEVKKEKKFSRSPNFDFTCIHFNICECLKWLEKPVFPVNFAKSLRAPLLQNSTGRLLLHRLLLYYFELLFTAICY